MSVNSHSADCAIPRKRPRQERSRRTVDRILDEAARIFARRGYRATTTNQVAEAAEVSIGSLYQYFPNKDALLAGLAERHLDDVVPLLIGLAERMEADEPAPRSLAEAVVEATLAVNDGPLYRLLHDAPRTPAVNERFDALTTMAAESLTHHFVRFGQPPDVASARAHLAVLLVDAAAHDVRAGEPIVRDQLVTVVTELADPTGRWAQVP